MASKTIVTLEDDLDGGRATQSLEFAFDGLSYSIDLNDRNAARLREALAPFIAGARRQRGNGAKSAISARTRPNDVDPRAVRAWAVDQGYDISTRGRVPIEVMEAYKAAH
jgi:hypothetical protein